MVNHAQDFVAVKKYEILQYSLIPTSQFCKTMLMYTFIYNPVKNIFNVLDIFSSYAKRYFATKYMNIISVENNRICL